MKLIVLFGLAVVTIDCALGFTVPKQEHPIFYLENGPWDPVKDITEGLETLEKGIANAINTAKEKILEVLKGLSIYYNELKEEAQQDIDKLIEEAVKVISLVTNVPENVLENCVKTSGIETVPIELMDDLLQCAKDKVTEVVAKVDQISYNIDNAIDIVSTFKSRLDSCGTDLNCYVELLKAIGVAAIRIPSNTASNVDQIVKIVTNAKQDLAVCAENQITHAGSLISNDVENIKNCVNSVK